MIEFEFIEKNIPHYYLYQKNLNFNYFESEYYKIKISNDYKFYIYVENNIINIQRIDSDSGWEKDLELNIFNKIKRISNNINIGNSNKNIVNIKLNQYYIDEKIHYETD